MHDLSTRTHEVERVLPQNSPMTITRFHKVPGTARGDRFLWLVVVPTVCAFMWWLLIFAGSGGGPSPRAIEIQMDVAGTVPMLGLVAVVGYRWLTQDLVRLLIHVPYGVVAAVFAVSMIQLAPEVAAEPDGAFIPVVQVASGFLLPWVALACGLVSFNCVDHN